MLKLKRWKSKKIKITSVSDYSPNEEKLKGIFYASACSSSQELHYEVSKMSGKFSRPTLKAPCLWFSSNMTISLFVSLSCVPLYFYFFLFFAYILILLNFPLSPHFSLLLQVNHYDSFLFVHCHLFFWTFLSMHLYCTSVVL